MAAPPSTPDPTGYPYLCHTDFALPPGQKVDGSIIAISAGTKGKITGYSKASNGQEWCSITTPYETPQRIGWVPLGYLHVGSRKYGDLELEIESQVIMKMPAVAPLKSESQLTKAIRYYFLSCKENASKIKFLQRFEVFSINPNSMCKISLELWITSMIYEIKIDQKRQACTL
jgi:hypothetical protein